MTNKLKNTQCSLRQTADSSDWSQTSSRIQQRQTNNSLKRLSFSLQNIKNPFPQTLPLKFPKNRIVKGFNTHMLTETQQIKFKPGVRQSYMQNQQFQQKPPIKSKSKGLFYTFNQQSLDNNINHSLKNHSLQKLHNSSLQKQSKKIFEHIIVQQTLKNPITFGEQNDQRHGRSFKKVFQQKEKQKNYSKEFKKTFQWSTDLSKQKERFNNKCNAKPKDTQLTPILNLNLTKNKQKRQLPKTQRNMRQRQVPKTLKHVGCQQTYASIYKSKRKCLGF